MTPVLAGLRVVDASRMIPGAVLARSLLALGAEVIKLEDPRGGDPMRAMPPLRGGIGVGFATYYAGAHSVVAPVSIATAGARVTAAVGRSGPTRRNRASKNSTSRRRSSGPPSLTMT